MHRFGRCWGSLTVPFWYILLVVLLPQQPIVADDSVWYDPVRGIDYWKAEWRQRSIYQIQMDRFATSNPVENECTSLRDLTQYCGGDFEGLSSKMDYIKGMNFDAVMVSSVVDQSPGGYHGYWPSNYYDVNARYGQARQLKNTIATMETAGIHVMLDVVVNHVGYGDYSYYHPFNKPEHFHNCTGCGHYIYWDCSIPPDFQKWQNLDCRLAGLPDLDQDNPYVFDQLMTWIKWMRGMYGFTAMRVDALANIPPAFAQQFTNVSGLFALGELPTASDSLQGVLGPVVNYMNPAAGLGLLDFFSVDPIRAVFLGEWRCYEGFGTPWNGLGTTVCNVSDRMDPFMELDIRSTKRLAYTYQAFVDYKIDQSLLGRFIDNQDFKRFIAASSNKTALRNALTYLFCNEGIPVLYYGTEQEVTGVEPNLKDFQSREPLWLVGYSRATPTYTFIRMLNWYRWKMELWDLTLDPVYVDDNYYAFRRGTSFLAVVTNGQHGSTIALPLTSMEPGVKLCNVMPPHQCFRVDSDGNAIATMEGGMEPAIFVLPSIHHDVDYFIPPAGLKVQWLHATIATIAAVAAGLISGLIVAFVAKPMGERSTTLLLKLQAYFVHRHRATDAYTVSAPFTEPAGMYELPVQCNQSSALQLCGSNAERDGLPLPSASSILTIADSIQSTNEACTFSLIEASSQHSEAQSASTSGSGANSIQGAGAASARSQIPIQTPKSISKPVARIASPLAASKDIQIADTSEQTSTAIIRQEGAVSTKAARSLQMSAAKAPRVRRVASMLQFTDKDTISDSVPAAQTSTDQLDGGGMYSLVRQHSLSSNALLHDMLRDHSPKTSFSSGNMCRTLSRVELEALSVIEPVDLAEPRVVAQPMSAWNKVQAYLGLLADMELHVTLEYSVPHLGHTNSLMYGGLGKMVDIFVRCTDVPIAVCAPMYAAFYKEGGKLDQLQLLLSFELQAGNTSHEVDVFSTLCEDRVAYFLLQADIFRSVERDTIHSFANEEAQLTALSVFNQATARVINAFGFQNVQFHDYHGVMSLLYLPAVSRPNVLYVAHNSDYNGVWPLGLQERTRYLFSMFALPFTAEIQLLLVHEGSFNMLHSVVSHIVKHQAGRGLVAVSPRYAERILRKFSVMWPLPETEVTGILNAIDGLPGVDVSMEEMLKNKKIAKLAFQQEHGLQPGAQYRLLVFVGRLTHQKGSDLLSAAAQRILSKHKDVQVAIGGPIGDWNGKAAADGLSKVAANFPGRMWNAAGKYIDGRLKEQLVTACDLFLCPSRFEPCGLTDIEFGRAGALIIGHDTGGLGKMPGWYFKEDLDNVSGMSNRLAEAASKALAAPADKVYAMQQKAITTEFPPKIMLQKYRKVWEHVRAGRQTSKSDMATEEKECFNDMWQADNLPLISDETKPVKERVWKAVIANIIFILMQSLLQLPALFTFVWYLVNNGAGSIAYKSDAQSSWRNLQSTQFRQAFVLFMVYAAGAIVWQALAFQLPARRYLLLASTGYFFSCVAAVWATYIVQVASPLCLATFAAAPASGPVIGFIFADQRNQISVSEYGPAVMGVSDGAKTFMIFMGMLMVFIADRAHLSSTAFKTFAIIMLVVSVWLLQFVLSSVVPPMYKWFQLTTRGQFGLLARHRKTWYTLLMLSAVESFLVTLIASVVYNFHGWSALVLFGALYFGVGCLSVVTWAIILSRNTGKVPLVKLMYAVAVFPGLAIAQMACVVWGKNLVWVIVAASAFQIGMVRYHLSGVLTLHTLSSRSMLSIVVTCQTVIGSVFIALGGLSGYLAGRSSSAKLVNMSLACLCEVLRVLLVALLAKWHKKENIAIP